MLVISAHLSSLSVPFVILKKKKRKIKMSTKLERISGVEAERVIAILEDATEKLVFLDR